MREIHDDPRLTKLLEESARKVKEMTPQQKEEMIKAQRESWARQDMD